MSQSKPLPDPLRPSDLSEPAESYETPEFIRYLKSGKFAETFQDVEIEYKKYVDSVWMKHGNLFYAIFSNLSFAKMLLLFIFRKYPKILDWLDLSTIELAPKDFSLLFGHERQADLLYFVKMKKPDDFQEDPNNPFPEDLGMIPIALLGEHKHQGSPGDPIEQLTIGSIGIHQRQKNNFLTQIKTSFKGMFWPVISFIFWHGLGKYPYVTNYRDLLIKTRVPEIDSLQLSQESLLCDLSDYSRERLWEEVVAIGKKMDQDAFVQANYPVFGCVLDLLQGIDGAADDITRRTVEDLALLEPLTVNSEVTLIVDLLIFYLQSTKNNVNRNQLAVLRNNFQCRKGELMESTSFAQYMATKWLAEGFYKGGLEGEARGKAEGKAEGKAQLITAYLKRRFGNVPKYVQDAIGEIQDSVVLDSIFEAAIDSQSLEEFEKNL